MAYRVEFPPDIAKETEISGGVSLPKNIGKSGKGGKHNQSIDATEGPIVALKIASIILGTEIWLAFRDDFQPDEGGPLAVFYVHELALLSKKTPEQLREIHKLKRAFGPGSWVRQ